jgi:RNA polymerase II subunit A C-terminal domain phosphatase SSU72
MSIKATSLPRPMTPPGFPPASARRVKSKLSFGVVCSSNINRSMEAHLVLSNAGLTTESYGTGTQVRLPGRTAMEPQIFKFGTPYSDMYQSLITDDAAYFSRNGVLQLCRRGASVKRAPCRWQDTSTEAISQHDVVIAFEERIFDAMIEDMQLREPTEEFSPIHVICLDTKDNPHEAALQGQVALDLCWRLENSHDLQVEAAEIINQFQEERATVTPIKVLYQVCYL